MKRNLFLAVSIFAAAAMLSAPLRAAESATERAPVIARHETLQYGNGINVGMMSMTGKEGVTIPDADEASGAVPDSKQKISLQNRGGRYRRQWYDTHVHNPLVQQNPFLRMPMEEAPLPTFEASKKLLPDPYWQGHDQTIACYWKAWELAFKNLRRPTPENGYVANYIDTAFNGGLFMWDSSFILMFGQYAGRHGPRVGAGR